MAIELIEIYDAGVNSSTAGSADMARHQDAIWMITQLQNVLDKTGMFSKLELDYPETASTGTSRTAYKVVAYVKVNGEDVPAFSLTPYSSAVSNTLYYCKGYGVNAYYANGQNILDVHTDVSSGRRCSFDLAYVTSNGALFRICHKRASSSMDAECTAFGSLLIAKSNGAFPVIISHAYDPSSTSFSTTINYHKYKVQVISYGDSSYIESSTYSATQKPNEYYQFATSAKQSVLAPFAAYGEASKFTFSPYAFWIPLAPTTVRDGGFKKIHIGDKNYVTDGYWALRDG